VNASNREKFSELFECAIASQKNFEVQTLVDAEFSEADGIEDLLPLLEPFGQGNASPQFLIRNYEISKFNVMKMVHLRFDGIVNGRKLSMLQFRSPYVELLQSLSRDRIELDLIGELSENEWKGQKRVEILLKDLLEVRVSGKRIEIRRDANEIGNRESLR
jgi:single-stranded DNA-specific DHH superfamily exonuclease